MNAAEERHATKKNLKRNDLTCDEATLNGLHHKQRNTARRKREAADPVQGEVVARGNLEQTLFKTLLARIGGLEGAIIYVDECDTLFPRRAAMANYQSVEVGGRQKMIAEFLAPRLDGTHQCLP